MQKKGNIKRKKWNISGKPIPVPLFQFSFSSFRKFISIFYDFFFFFHFLNSFFSPPVHFYIILRLQSRPKWFTWFLWHFKVPFPFWTLFIRPTFKKNSKGKINNSWVMTKRKNDAIKIYNKGEKPVILSIVLNQKWMENKRL